MHFIWKHFRGFMHKGEPFKEIFRLWTPEVIAQTIFISLPPLVDSYLVASLKSTTIYGALGMANHFVHLLMKFSEAIPVAAIAIIGRYNGAKEYDKCGRGLGDTFWTTLVVGFAQFMLVFSGAATIYRWLNVPEDMLVYGVPFLRMRSIGLLLVFVSLAFIAFMNPSPISLCRVKARSKAVDPGGIKNTSGRIFPLESLNLLPPTGNTAIYFRKSKTTAFNNF